MSDPVEERIRILVTELKSLELFEGLSDEELTILVQGCRLGRYGKDAPILCKENDPADDVIIILRGEVEVLKYDNTGSEYLMTVLPAGEFLGERTLVGSGTRSATVRAKGEVLALLIGRPEANQLLESYPRAVAKLVVRMMAAVSDRLRLLNEHYVLTKGCLDRLKSF